MTIRKFKNDFLSMIKSEVFLYTLGAIVVLLAVFQAGVFVGYRKAAFSYRYGDTFYRTFGAAEAQRGPLSMQDRMFQEHGTTGSILKVSGASLVIEGRDKAEHIVRITSETSIRRLRDNATTTDLASGDVVVVFGDANEKGEIEAKLIRVMPLPPAH